MVALPEPSSDPTLEAIDAEIVRTRETRFSRRLGASSIGRECERSLWYEFRWAKMPTFDALSIKRFEDGDRGETIMAARLRAIALELHTGDGAQQYEFEAIEGHFVFRPDGVLLGLLQASKTWHLWENKVSEKGPRELASLKAKLGEKSALRAWSSIYYAQAVIGMHLMGLTRCYHTVSSPGMRHTVSCRSEENPEEAKRLLAKARRVIEVKRAPARIGGETHHVCRMCQFAGVCHADDFPLVNCRTCLHSTPIEHGQWHCARWGKILTLDDQKEGCPAHLFIPDMVPGEQIDAAEDGAWVAYRLRNRKEWRDG